MQEIITSLKEAATSYAPTIGGALLVLIAGWLVAVLVSTVVRSLLTRTKLHSKAAGWLGEEQSEIDIPKIIGRIVFWLVIILTLVAVAQILDLTMAAGPLSELTSQVLEYLPRLFGAGLLLLVAWVVAKIVRIVVRKILLASGVDSKFNKTVSDGEKSDFAISRSIADTLHWIVFLLFLPAILGALQLQGILEPIQSMFDSLLTFLPQLLGAAIIAVVGWFVAKMVRAIVSNLVVAAGGDKLTEKYNLAPLSQMIGLVVYVLILLPVIIGALNALQLDSITAPASAMLGQILAALPNVFAAALVLAIAFVLARFLSGVVSRLLAGIGFDTLPAKLGFTQSYPEGARKPSDVAGVILLTAVLLFAAIEAASILGFDTLATLISQLTVLGGKILFGLAILAFGLYLAKLAAAAVLTSDSPSARTLALIVRIAILVLVGSMAIQQIGIANEIISLAFGLTLGAIAVAAAIAFGIGGREFARRQLERWGGSERPVD